MQLNWSYTSAETMIFVINDIQLEAFYFNGVIRDKLAFSNLTPISRQNDNQITYPA